MRSGPDVSASCAKCWKSVFKEKEVVTWKYGFVGYKEKKSDSAESPMQNAMPKCEHKILRIYRTDRYVAAKCMSCDTVIQSAPEIRLVRGAVVKPRIEMSVPSGSRIGRNRSTFEQGNEEAEEDEEEESRLNVIPRE